MISQIFVYPVAAVMCASLVSLALTWRPLFRVLSLRFVTFAGTISFGLYVFHFLGIFLARRIFDRLGLTLSPESNAAHYLVLALTAFAFTFALSTISYLWFESPFLRLKDRLAAVHGRPIL
jgi:peptidoglycan/LPS O-acetylase OafA/YrhL